MEGRCSLRREGSCNNVRDNAFMYASSGTDKDSNIRATKRSIPKQIHFNASRNNWKQLSLEKEH